LFVVTEIPKALLEFGPFMKLYFSYVSHHEDAVESLRKFRVDYVEFDRFVRCLERGQNDSMQSLFIKPVQRIPRYRLLLERIVKLARSADKSFSESDMNSLLQSLEVIESIAAKLDHDMRMKEKRLMVVELQQKLFKNREELVTASRFFMRKGVLRVNLQPEKGKSYKRYHCILFNDLLIIGALFAGRFRVKLRLDISRMSVMEAESNSNMEGDGFVIEYANESDQQQRIFVSCTDTEEEKSGWINDLLECLEAVNRNRRSLAPMASIQ